jgi:hypothetical protein
MLVDSTLFSKNLKFLLIIIFFKTCFSHSKTVASLQKELDEILQTDQFMCKLCTVKLKGESVEDHLMMFEPLPYDIIPTYDMAGKINLLNYEGEVEFVDYCENDNSACEFYDPIQNCNIIRRTNDVIVEPSHHNLNYYNAYLRYSKTLLDNAAHKLNQLQMFRGRSEAFNEAQENVELLNANAMDILDYAAACRHAHHILCDESHAIKSMDQLAHRDGIEKESLQVVVRAILLNRRVAEHLSSEALTSDDNTRDELELKFSGVERESASLRTYLMQCRTKKTFKTTNAINIIKNQAAKLEQAVEELEAILDRDPQSSGPQSKLIEQNRRGDVVDNDDDDEDDDDDDDVGDDVFRDGAEEQEEDIMGIKEGFQLSAKEKKKLKKK